MSTSNVLDTYRDLYERLERLERYEKIAGVVRRPYYRNAPNEGTEGLEAAIERVVVDYGKLKALLIEVVPAHGSHRPYWLDLFHDRDLAVTRLLAEWLRCVHCGKPGGSGYHYSNAACRKFEPALDVRPRTDAETDVELNDMRRELVEVTRQRDAAQQALRELLHKDNERG